MSANGQNGHEKVSYGLMPHTPENWEKLRLFFAGERAFVPPQELGVASIAALPDGTIVGGLILQLVSYLGPFKIDPLYRGHIDYVRMKKLIDTCYQTGRKGNLIIDGYIALTGDEALARIAEQMGMTRKPDCITLVQEFGEHVIVR